MKIIVDEMPKSAIDCKFIVELNTCLLTHAGCGLYDGECQHLKPITDFHAEKVIEKYDDGSRTVQQFDIR